MRSACLWRLRLQSWARSRGRGRGWRGHDLWAWRSAAVSQWSGTGGQRGDGPGIGSWIGSGTTRVLVLAGGTGEEAPEGPTRRGRGLLALAVALAGRTCVRTSDRRPEPRRRLFEQRQLGREQPWPRRPRDCALPSRFRWRVCCVRPTRRWRRPGIKPDRASVRSISAKE